MDSCQPPRPSSWTPTGFSDPDSETKLLCRMQLAVDQLNNSRFARCFLSRLHHPQIQQPLNNLLSLYPHIQIVSYGIGSIESSNRSRLQLALALLLKKELGIKFMGPIEVFDPILSVVECNVLAALGCRVIAVNEYARRETTMPTIFYMPHCEEDLYDNLVSANWKPMMLRRMVVLGNSFGFYQKYVWLMGHGFYSLHPGMDRRSVELGVNRRHLLWIRKYVREVKIEERENIDNDFKGYEDGVEFQKAFSSTSWHFFEIDDDAYMGFVYD